MPYYRYPNSNYYRPSFMGGFKLFPPVIKMLLISNVVVFMMASFIARSSLQGASLEAYLALYPLGKGFQIWQLFTYMYMHGGLMHLLFNMLALWMFGMELENTWGAKKFFSYYTLCGVGAGIANLLLGRIGVPTVGASGAIYGVLIAFGMMYPDRPIFVYFLLPIKARYFVALYIMVELYAGVYATSDGVAHFAHLGGAAVGLIYMLIDQRRIPFQTLWHETKSKFVSQEHVQHSGSFQSRNISDAKYFDMNDRDQRVTQAQIDEILDKISQNGYTSLSEDEKKILFEASRKLN